MSVTLLEQLSQPEFASNHEVYKKDGAAALRNKSFVLFRSDKEKYELVGLFCKAVEAEAAKPSKGINVTNVLSNLKAFENQLQVSNGFTSGDIATIFHVVKKTVKAIGAPAKSKENSGMDFIMRRVTRFALYKLAQGGAFSVFAAGLSLPATLAKKGIVGTASLIFGPEGILKTGTAAVFGKGGAAHTGASAAAKGVSFTAGAVGTLFSSALMKEFIAFLAITEGPGVVGHVTRRLTPQPIKNVYNFVMPERAQKAINWVTYTDKPVANGLDAVGRKIAGIGRYTYDGLAVAWR